MRILWLCNVMLPIISEYYHVKSPATGGWLVGTADRILNGEEHSLGIVFPQRIKREVINGTIGNLEFWGFPRFVSSFDYYDSSLETLFSSIVSAFQPDIIHIWGTEFSHSLSMMRVVTNREKTIISIQGLVSQISHHYHCFLPREAFKPTIRDILRRDGLHQQKKVFEQRGLNEIETLKLAKNVIGRTRWDKICCAQLANDAKYFHCNETLRKTFYQYASQWQYETCEKHSIFVSQCSYPVKGFHLVLEAVGKIKNSGYEDVKLYTTGVDPRTIPFYKISSYQNWIITLIDKYDLHQNVFFMGTLGEREMCERYLKSNVFVSASSIENSPNSVGEAMILGVPIIASYVGGVMDMIIDQEEGILYPADESYVLAEYIMHIFKDVAFATKIGRNAYKHALLTHNIEQNYSRLMEIYTELI